MGDTDLIYRQKLDAALDEAERHLSRIDTAYAEIAKSFKLPMLPADFHGLLSDNTLIAFADQIIYRFSKAQDCMGAKLFKAFLLYQGENIDRPFLDILHSLEKIAILNVDQWFELREIRNEIAHDYENSEEVGREILNSIFSHRGDLRRIVESLRRQDCSGGRLRDSIT
jgi:hypothetical protein